MKQGEMSVFPKLAGIGTSNKINYNKLSGNFKFMGTFLESDVSKII